MEKRNLKRSVVIVIITIVLLVAAIIAYLVITDAKQEDILRNEIATLAEKDIAKDRYNTAIKTREDYAKVEKTIKEYYDEYATTFQDVADIVNSKELGQFLTAKNYAEDGPEFTKTKKYLSDTKEEFNTKLEKLTKMNSDDQMMAAIKGQGLDKYYINLYEELMVRGIKESNFEKILTELETTSNKINAVIEVQEKVIDLLIENKDKWSIQDEKIVFKDTDTLNNYNELTKKYQKESAE